MHITYLKLKSNIPRSITIRSIDDQSGPDKEIKKNKGNSKPRPATKLSTKPKVKSTTQSTTTIATNGKESKTDSEFSITIFFDPFDQPRHMIHVLHPKDEGLQLHLFAVQYS